MEMAPVLVFGAGTNWAVSMKNCDGWETMAGIDEPCAERRAWLQNAGFSAIRQGLALRHASCGSVLHYLSSKSAGSSSFRAS